MNVRTSCFLSVCLCANLLIAAEPTYKLAKSGKVSAGLSKPFAALLNPEGFRVVGPKGPVCDLWFVKSPAVQPGFTPTLMVKYPFTSGQLLGVVRVAEKAEFTEFRGEEMAAGLYSLRYGQQPEDGNHIGTSEVADFLLAIPAKKDVDPRIIASSEDLSKISAETIESDHPAIFSLLPSQNAPRAASLTHDLDRDYWILDLAVDGVEGKKKVRIPIRLVVIGQAEE